MNLIDTNAVNYVLETSFQCKDIYYLAPEVQEEVEETLNRSSKQLPTTIIDVESYSCFNGWLYLDFYKKMLNKHDGRSFFNMTGFGDISILATIHTVLEFQQLPLFPLYVFTDDHGLTKRIAAEFPETVCCKSYKNIR